MKQSEFEYIIERVVTNAEDALKEAKENINDDFYQGKKLAYYEVLDTIKNELIIRNQNLEKFKLKIDLDKTFL